jgi:hypothetical protein
MKLSTYDIVVRIWRSIAAVGFASCVAVDGWAEREGSENADITLYCVAFQ